MADQEEFFPIPDWLEGSMKDYKDKLAYEVLKKKLEDAREKMNERNIRVQSKMAYLQRKTKKVMNRLGVDQVNRFGYITYVEKLWLAKETYKLHYEYKVDFYRELNVIAEQFKRRGLDQKAMYEIAKIANCKEIKKYLNIS